MTDKPKTGPEPEIEVSSDHSDSWSDVTSSRIDIVQEKPSVLGSRDTSDVSSEVAIRRIRGLRVLVLGNDSDRLFAVSEELGELGLEVGVGAADYPGFRTALRFRPDVVLSELARPGEPGWWVVQRLRRHPLPRWSPVLLMKWWEVDEDGTGKVLLPRVVERIADALTPSRVLEERISAGRQLADRLEMIGAPGLARTLSGARLSGLLTVNDAWNVFELRFEGGNVVSASRRGVDGEVDDGETAFFQFMLCDVGRWSFRKEDAGPVVRNILLPFSELVSSAAVALDRFFGAPSRGTRADTAFKVRPGLFHDLASMSRGVSRQVAEALAAGVSNQELEALLGDEADRQDIERTLSVFLRSGAILPVDKLGPVEPGSREERTSRATEALLSWISLDFRPRVGEGKEERLGVTGTGLYRSHEVAAESVSLGRSNVVAAPGAGHELVEGRTEPVSKDPNATAPIVDIGGDERPTPIIHEDEMAWREVFPDGPMDVDSRANKLLPHDSLVPPPAYEPEEERSKKQMWLAIALAIVLGLLMVAGLVAVSSVGRDEPPRGDTTE